MQNKLRDKRQSIWRYKNICRSVKEFQHLTQKCSRKEQREHKGREIIREMMRNSQELKDTNLQVEMTQ